jgi:DNA-binding transcriptional LysR family regulator
MGVAIRSIWDMQSYLKAGKLIQVLENHPLDPFGDIYVIIPNRRLMAHRVRVFNDFLMNEAKSRKF